jgi:hypothetical protein
VYRAVPYQVEDEQALGKSLVRTLDKTLGAEEWRKEILRSTDADKTADVIRLPMEKSQTNSQMLPASISSLSRQLQQPTPPVLSPDSLIISQKN